MIRLLAPLCLVPLPALAEVPRVMTDIAPIHSLTAQVMGDLGTPDLLLPPGANPHDFALRPSDAEKLGDAALVIWVGDALTPWLEESLTTLAPSATQLSLLDTEGWDKLDIRELKEINAGGDDDHGHNDDHDDDHGDDHAKDDDDDHAHHDHGDFDPHAWADPTIAQVWLDHIAAALSEADPDNAATYLANADAAQTRIVALDAALTVRLSPLAGRSYILPHDGYQYFEAHFGLTAVGALANVDARTPGPAQVASLREQMAADDVTCVLSDVEIGERWGALLTEGTDAKTAVIDAVGVGLQEGPDLYGDMMARLGDNFAACLGE